jgi:hypothetical protein
MLNFYLHKISSFLSILFLLVLLVGSNQAIYAQNGQNPFEIIPRLEKPPVQAAETEEGTTPVSTGNPFDIVRGKLEVEKKPQKVQSQPKVAEETPKKDSEVKPAFNNKSSKKEGYRQFLFITLLVLLVILTLIFTIFRSVISASYRGFLNDNILGQLHRDQRVVASFPFQVLYILFFVNAGTFVFVVLKHFGISLSGSNLIGLSMCIGGISLIFILKHILLKIVGAIFPIEKELGTYSFTIIVFQIILGIALLPFMIFIAYGTEELIPYAIYGAFIMIGIFYIYRSLRGLFIGNRFLAYHKFHFLLYICTVEIAPLVVLLKVLLSGGV